MVSLNLTFNFLLFLLSFFGLVFNTQNIITVLMCIELMLLSINLNFIIFSLYLDDLYGQLFSMFILTIAAAESAIGLALIIVFYRVRGSVTLNKQTHLRA